jgi:restriction system protein
VNWTLPKNSLFAILLRSPWWKSLGIAVILSLIAATFLPERLKLAGALASFPFVVIGLIAAWKQLKQPGAARVERTATALRELDWARFDPLLQAALVRDGYSVERSRISGIDFEVFKGGRRGLIVARRWKSAHLGIEPLRSLREAADKVDSQDAIYLSLGDLSEAAVRYANTDRVQIWDASRLASLNILPG